MIDFVFVNHSKHEIDFMKAQSRVFPLCNPSGGYRLIAADGTGDGGHRAQLEDLGFTVISYEKTPIDWDWDWDDSAQHGEGLQIGLQYVNAHIFCAQDPDHFWVGKEFCSTVEDLMEQYIVISMGSNLDVGKNFEIIKQKLGHQDDAEAAGQLRRPTGLVSLMGGTFFRTDVIRQNRLTFEHNRKLYRKSNWDEGFLIVNYLEKYRRDEVLWLTPHRIGLDDRPLSFTCITYLDGKPFGLHIKGGSIKPGGGFGFADKTKELRPELIAYAEKLARENCK